MKPWKKIGRALLFPPVAILLVLLPVAVVSLVFSMVYMGDGSVAAIVSYVLSAYTLAIWCLRLPEIIRFFKTVKNENRYVRRWLEDTRMRTNITMYGSLLWNLAYAVMQLGLGYIHATVWFYSLAAYYLCLGLMRFYLVRYTTKHKPGEYAEAEILRYRVCGWIFLLMNLAITLMIFFMVRWNRTFAHHKITTIALAAYTFTTFTFAIINVVKYRKYNSPVLSAGKAIRLASASVSMLTLESTMLTAFQDDGMDLLTRKVLLGATGGVVSAFIIVMAIYMIVQSTKKLNGLQFKEK